MRNGVWGRVPAGFWGGAPDSWGERGCGGVRPVSDEVVVTNLNDAASGSEWDGVDDDDDMSFGCPDFLVAALPTRQFTLPRARTRRAVRARAAYDICDRMPAVLTDRVPRERRERLAESCERGYACAPGVARTKGGAKSCRGWRRGDGN